MRRQPPLLGEHNDEVLAEIGVAEDREALASGSLRAMSEGEVRFENDGASGGRVRPAGGAQRHDLGDVRQLGAICERRGRRGTCASSSSAAPAEAFVAGTDIAHSADFSAGEDSLAYERKMDGYLAASKRCRADHHVDRGYAVGGGLASRRPATSASRRPMRASASRSRAPSATACPQRVMRGFWPVFSASRAPSGFLLLGEMIGAEEAQGRQAS